MINYRNFKIYGRKRALSAYILSVLVSLDGNKHLAFLISIWQ